MSVFRKQTSRKGSLVYEEVLQKNFEIIQTFLKKFHQIFTKQQQFEEHLNKFAQSTYCSKIYVGFTQYDDFLDQFKQEQRLNFVMLEKKVNNMKSTVRQSHRGSHRFSKINIPIFEAVQNAQGGKSKYKQIKTIDFTLLKFNSINTPSPRNEQPPIVQKKPQQPQSNKKLDQLQQSLTSIKDQISQLKQKVTFLSVYTSSLSNNQNSKSKIQTVKKQILQQFESQSKQKIQKQIRNRMIQTQKIFLQQINNLALKFSDQLKFMIQSKFKVSQDYIKNMQKTIFTKNDSQVLANQFNKQLKALTLECVRIFPKKQETNKCLSILEKKIKIIESLINNELLKGQNQTYQNLKSIINVNSSNNQVNNTSNTPSTPHHPRSTTASLHKSHKSQSTKYFKKSHSNSISELKQQPKAQNFNKFNEINDFINRQPFENKNSLSKGLLFTNKVSKDFMKNFGLKQKNIINTKKGGYYQGMYASVNSGHAKFLSQDNTKEIRCSQNDTQWDEKQINKNNFVQEI